MKHHYNSKNPELTKKALEFISRYGRNSFDKMINELLDQKINPVKQGFIKNHKEVKKMFKKRGKE